MSDTNTTQSGTVLPCFPEIGIPALSDDGLAEARQVLDHVQQMLNSIRLAGLAEWKAVQTAAQLVLDAPAYAEMRAIPFFQDWPYTRIDRGSALLSALNYWKRMTPAEQQEAHAALPMWLESDHPFVGCCAARAYLTGFWKDGQS